MTQKAELTGRSLFRVEGDEAVPFLQNLVTCDVESLKTGDATFGALLTPQGKILFEFVLLRTSEGFLGDCRAEMRGDLIKRLTFYRLRAAVILEADERKVFAIWDGENCEGFADPRLPALGNRLYDQDLETTTGDNNWNAWRISLGIAELGADFEPSSVFPHETMMDQFKSSGVDFSKGCYVGQEVVSRMHHRATARNRFVHVAALDEQTLPERGTPVLADGKTLGTMGSHIGSKGLALMRLDRTAKAMSGGNPILAKDVEIAPSLPAFFDGQWPQ